MTMLVVTMITQLKKKQKIPSCDIFNLYALRLGLHPTAIYKSIYKIIKSGKNARSYTCQYQFKADESPALKLRL